MKPAYRNSLITSITVIVIDWLTFNAAMFLCDALGLWFSDNPPILSQQWSAFNIAYIITQFIIRITLHRRGSTVATILRNSFTASLLIVVLNAALLGMLHIAVPGLLRCMALFGVIFLLVAIERIIVRQVVRHLRSIGRNTINVVIIGNEEQAAPVLDVMNDKYNGYNVQQIFAHTEDAMAYLKHNFIDEIYICTAKRSSQHIKGLLKFCTHEMIRVFFIPGETATYQRSMQIHEFGSTYVLAMYREPLMNGGARMLKRTFDIVFSIAFLCTLFPIMLIVVSIVTGITMPGPVFFRQKRTGYDGREFWCYKFRSMKVNAAADTIQATKDDERITRWGKIMRHTNIDEFPQFINVLMGDMSVVGPRPHMLAHTEYYSARISDYMVRHYVRPGITGWAQTCGERGETETVDDMARRVEKDIWYIEHWSFWLDIQIILKTIFNMFTGDDKAY